MSFQESFPESPSALLSYIRHVQLQPAQCHTYEHTCSHIPTHLPHVPLQPAQRRAVQQAAAAIAPGVAATARPRQAQQLGPHAARADLSGRRTQRLVGAAAGRVLAPGMVGTSRDASCRSYWHAGQALLRAGESMAECGQLRVLDRITCGRPARSSPPMCQSLSIRNNICQLYSIQGTLVAPNLSQKIANGAVCAWMDNQVHEGGGHGP
eukprot:364358-Chlamydomonas_euryale.AAC.19